MEGQTKCVCAHLVDDLDLLLTALGMHPMNCRTSFKILRINLRDMKTDHLAPAIIQLKERFANLDDETLRDAWYELHNPFHYADEVRH
ncbi:hypothetical protein [Hyphococcus sp.]|uniref:hypothetical protein n=1 Tax=Hyphococcus sp. TaxID=2038636 RepID=UPI0035C6EDAD